MKRFTLLSIAAAAAMAATTASAQTFNAPKAFTSKVKAAIAKVIKKEYAIVGAANTNGMNLSTTLPAQTTTYSYANGSWQKENTTKTEYNAKGYATATETEEAGAKTRVVYEYDDKLEGFATKATLYSWDETTSTWTNPVVAEQVELERDSKGRVTKETVYVYDDDTKALKKESEADFEYSLLTGKLSTLSTTIEDDSEGTAVSVPLKLTILKWYKYDENKLFNFNGESLNGDILEDKDNLIESATLTMTMAGMPITGTLKGTYTDNSEKMEVSLMGIINMTFSTTTTDAYGSFKEEISMNYGNETMGETITATNNEYGDCVRVETTEIGGGEASTQALGDINIDDVDMNQVITMDYEYLSTSTAGVLKKSMTVNSVDKETGTPTPTQKVTYDEYVDYVSGTTGIGSVRKNTATSQNKAVYGVDGTFSGKSLNKNFKGVYIVKEGDKTYKIAR